MAGEGVVFFSSSRGVVGDGGWLCSSLTAKAISQHCEGGRVWDVLNW